MRLIILIISLVLCLKACIVERYIQGVLVLDNQSDYRIDITFYESNLNVTGWVNNTNSLSDSVPIRIEPNAEWVTSYGLRGGGGGLFTIQWILQPADSAKIIYNDERIAFSPNPTGRDLLYNASSYTETRTKVRKSLFRRKEDVINFRYIFTNADYEAAKPIDP